MCCRGVGLLSYVRACGKRFAKWKRDAEYWFVQDTLTFERLLGKVTNDLVCTYGPYLILSQQIEVVNLETGQWNSPTVFCSFSNPKSEQTRFIATRTGLASRWHAVCRPQEQHEKRESDSGIA